VNEEHHVLGDVGGAIGDPFHMALTERVCTARSTVSGLRAIMSWRTRNILRFIASTSSSWIRTRRASWVSRLTRASSKMTAQATGYEPGDFVHTLGDAHLYKNRLEQTRLQRTRELRPLPRLRLDPSVTDLFAFRYEHVAVEGYEPHPHIRARVSGCPPPKRNEAPCDASSRTLEAHPGELGKIAPPAKRGDFDGAAFPVVLLGFVPEQASNPGPGSRASPSIGGNLPPRTFIVEDSRPRG
jgi:hypothetical protein